MIDPLKLEVSGKRKKKREIQNVRGIHSDFISLKTDGERNTSSSMGKADPQ